MPANTTWADIILAGIQGHAENVYISLPGVVETYYPLTQTADISCAVQLPVTVLDDGSTDYDTLPVFPQVPVAFPRGGGFFMAFPLAKGDGVTLVFSSLSHEDFRTTGQVPSAPTDVQRNGPGSPIAIPCNIQDLKALTALDAAAAGAHMVVGKEGGPQIHLDGSTVSLGSLATDFVALSSKVDAALVTILAAYNAHTHPTAAVGPVSPPSLLVPSVPTVASTFTKSK